VDILKVLFNAMQQFDAYTHSPNDYKNNHSKQNPPMKSHSREDELQELHLIRNTPPAMIALTGRRRVGKTDCIIEGK